MSDSKDSDFQPFLQKTSNVFGQNRLLKIMVGIMVFGVWMIYASVQDFKTHQQTIIIPGGNKVPYEIRNYSAGPQYTFDMANYLVYLAGNFTPLSVTDKFNILLGMFHESAYSRYQSHFKLMSQEIKKFKNISHMAELAYPDPLFVRENQLRIRMKKSKVVGTTIKPPEIMYLLVDYEIIDGRFWIMNLQELSQTEYAEVQRDEK